MGYYRKVNTHTNLIGYSETITSWTERGGTEAITANDILGPDGVTMADKITGLNVVFTDDIWRWVQSTNVPDSSRVEPSFWIKKDSSTGVLRVIDPIGGGPPQAGSWNVDFSKLSNEWERITRWHNAVQINTEFVSDDSATPRTGIHLYADSGGPLSFWLWGVQIEAGTRPNPYIKADAGGTVTAATKRDNHWHKDHNGIWRRSLKMEGPKAGYAEWTNLVDYSAGPFKDNSFWDDPTADYTSLENVVSCIEGGTALRAVSVADRGVRIHSYGNFGTNSGGVEVMSGIFERVNQEYSAIASWDGSWTNYIQANYDWSNKQLDLNDSQGLHVDRGFENLGVGPNGGELVRIWIAFDTGHVDWSGNARNIQWRVDNNFSGVETGILHHAQYYEIPSGYSNSDNGAPTGPIVNLDATNNSINREQFSIPISFNPQALSVYIRFKQMWRDGQHTAFSIGGATGERLKLENSNGATGTYFFRHHDGSSLVQDVGFGVGVDFGDTVEFAGVLNSDGSVQAWESVNGAAWVEGTASGALAFTGSWGESLVHIGSMDDSNFNQCFIEVEAFKIVGTAITDAAGAEWLRGYKETGTREY